MSSNDQDWLVRMRAAYALEMIDDARAIEPLTQALKNEEEEVQSSAYSALLKIKISPLEKKRDVDGLIKALKDEDILVRERAAQALGRIGNTKAVEPLIQAINEDKYPYTVGKASKEALKEIKTRLSEAVEE